MVLRHIKGLFQPSANDVVDVAADDQRKIAQAVLAPYKNINVANVIEDPALATLHFKNLLETLDEHGVIDLASVPVKGKGNRVSVPSEWGAELIDVLDNFSSPEKWAGKKDKLKAVWKDHIPTQLKKLELSGCVDEYIGAQEMRLPADIVLSNYSKVKGGMDIKAEKSDKPFAKAAMGEVVEDRRSEARSEPQNVPHPEKPRAPTVFH